MAQIRAAQPDRVIQIKKWLGVNENPDGDTNLKPGEASAMTNFRITNDNLLQIRPGTQEVAGLLSAYTITTAATATTVATDILTATHTFTCYPGIAVSAGGILSLTGSPVTVNSSNITSYSGYYWTDGNSNYYALGSLSLVHPAIGTPVTGGSIMIGEQVAFVNNGPILLYPGITITSGGLVLSGAPQSSSGSDLSVYKYYFSTETYSYGFLIVDGGGSGPYYAYYSGHRVSIAAYDTYNWNFYRVTATSAAPNKAVKGIWSGRVGTTEYIVAACNSHLWSLSESGGVWSKADIGSINTTGARVHMFGFEGKLYILDGNSYWVWNGTTLLSVAGYRPLTFVSTIPTGGGTARERINMLNGLRRVWFSPTGSATVFQLQEAGLASIDYVKNLATGYTYSTPAEYSVNTASGTVTFGAAPATGTNTIEIGYTYPTTFRSQIVAMTLSETYNGVSDNRVFIYGDGTNKAFYSDLDYNGQATAEYFPDLNVIHVGDANTPLTSMVRHYDRLVAFKEDSAYSIRYDTITLVTGVVTAGFYCTTVNKGLGSAGYGQAVVVENHPRTLDGRSIYEWQATTSSGNITGDQRNAKRISQNVETTIRNLDLATALSFFDKINHEHFIVQNGIAIVQNTENGAWYIYRDFPAVCMIVYKDELYFGTADGFIRHVSRGYMHDNGAPITAYWESGSMDFGANYMRKYSDSLYIGIKPESKGALKVTVQTDRQTAYDDPTVIANYTGEVDSGFFSWLDLDFDHFSFNVNDKPQMQKLKIKVKNFVFYKLIFSSVSATTTATITSADFKVRYVGNVR